MCLWGVLELNIKFPISYDINKNNNQTKKSVKMYKTNFGDDTITKISDGICNNQNDIPEIFCVNCYRRFYSSNYTGTNMCSECKKYYYSDDFHLDKIKVGANKEVLINRILEIVN